jgi:Zn-dependent peptidase ImmA (M78 family)/transcriptional regulator with XRE-family HTH domain
MPVESKPTFCHKRLEDAVKARGVTWKALADIADIKPTTLSDYKKGYIKPSHEQLARISGALGFPLDYFLRPTAAGANLVGPFLCRASSSLTQRAADQAEMRLAWMAEALVYADRYLELPKPTFLEGFTHIQEPLSLGAQQIESIALSVRDKLGYGLNPIANLVRTLERSGVAILRYVSVAKVRIDGLSQHSELGRPLCAIVASEETSLARETFSLAHELGHIVLHGRINEQRFNELADAKILEDQANRFASSFLLPAVPFLDDVKSASIGYFEHLKRRWRVSIAAMIRRCYDLGRITISEYSSLNVRLSQKRWRKREPLDDAFEVENPVLLSKVFTALEKDHRINGSKIAYDLCLRPRDLAYISGLPLAFFEDNNEPNLLEFPGSLAAEA